MMADFRKLLLVTITMLLCTTICMAENKKVLYIDSYHEGYAWSDGQREGVKNILGDKYDIKWVFMDTKRNPSEEYRVQAGKKVKEEIDTWKPDVVIAADDNTAIYVIVPFYKDSDVPFVFCGLNWDASIYGFPWKNVTGILEVTVMLPLLEHMKKYAKGDRLGFLGSTQETDRKEYENLTKRFNLHFNAKFVDKFEDWKTSFKQLQDECDMLYIVNYAGIKGWDDEEAKKFVREYTKVPTGSAHDFVAPYVLIDYAKSAEEQGEWAARTALQIMKGKSPADIPIASNKKGILYVNLAIAKKLGIRFPLETLKIAKTIKE